MRTKFNWWETILFTFVFIGCLLMFWFILRVTLGYLFPALFIPRARGEHMLPSPETFIFAFSLIASVRLVDWLATKITGKTF